MKTFIRNNLSFRVVSSNAIAKFKAGQAFDFNELSRKTIGFSISSKESLLLEYEYWFKWLLRTEKIFLMLKPDETPVAITEQLVASISVEFEDIEEVMACHTDVFESGTLQFIKFLHGNISQSLKKILADVLIKDDIYSAFTKISIFISNYLQFVLFSLYELEACSSIESECFLGYNEFCEEIKNSSGKCLLFLKAEYFKNQFNISSCVIKNYTTNEIDQEHLAAIAALGIFIKRVEFVAGSQ